MCIVKIWPNKRVNLSTPRPEGRGLLEVHPEPRFPTPPSKAGLRAAERVNWTTGARPFGRVSLIRRMLHSINSLEAHAPLYP